jgi:hypothetical protein
LKTSLRKIWKYEKVGLESYLIEIVENPFWYYDSSAIKHVIGNKDLLVSLRYVKASNSIIIIANETHDVVGKGMVLACFKSRGIKSTKSFFYVLNIQKNLLSNWNNCRCWPCNEVLFFNLFD